MCIYVALMWLNGSRKNKRSINDTEYNFQYSKYLSNCFIYHDTINKYNNKRYNRNCFGRTGLENA